jgi:hypothetical protein
MGQQQYNNSHMLNKPSGALTSASGTSAADQLDEQKFNIVSVDCLVSNKTMTMQ